MMGGIISEWRAASNRNDGRNQLGIRSSISREALEDDAEPVQRDLSHSELLTLAAANVEVIDRVLNAKLQAGQAVTPAPGDRPRVVLRSGDLRAVGEKLSASVLTAPPFRWG